MKKIMLLIACFFFLQSYGQTPAYGFRVRTITAGITPTGLSDTASLVRAIQFLADAKKEFIRQGYAVQTLRVSTANLCGWLGSHSLDEALEYLEGWDRIARRNGVIISIGQVLAPDKEQAGIGDWAIRLVRRTKTISFSLPISSHELGIHMHSIKAAAEIIRSLSTVDNGEANFRFTAGANCPANIPFFPVAFHEGGPSFAIGLESANLVTEAFAHSDVSTARAVMKELFEKNLRPVQALGEKLAAGSGWKYDGIDVSTAPGLDASIGKAVETYTHRAFGDPGTLGACALITDVLKGLDIKKCGYSGLMLPVIEDPVLAKRAEEGRYTVEELLLFSSVSGTGLDVVPIPGDTPDSVIQGLLTDVAALSLKYTAKALSARLFLIPGKKAGDRVSFVNPALTGTVVMPVR